ncbi:SusC/RagA family TonB-linked outer membrane protein [Bacteroides ilei]|uniref:SusC/RagA family TonB-linked outer membrane protein n=1 Tax=Bacteroides ilei TaxID=1907658 RepID=UPI003AB20554
MKNVERKIQKLPFLLFCMLLWCLTASAQQGMKVKGTIFDSNGETIIGASVVVKGNASIGTISDFDGNFELNVPSRNSVLVISFVGMKTKEVKASQNLIKVTLEDDSQQLEEVVVVGYGQQKKASVVGSITQTSGKVLERAGGVSSLGAALTGNLPGVITSTSTGMPGEEDPEIIIRTKSSWNNSEPLVLVDGIEREMSSVDISSVESISVLKDASATAVYGVKGANGVILITTKRGKEGKANVQIKANMTAKVVSKLPEKYDAYDTFYLMNNSIEREAAINPAGWSNYTPAAIIDKYRHPANIEEWDRYPNVDWENYLFKDYAMSYNTSVNVSGGTSVVKYFAAADFVSEGDLFKTFDNNRGYNSGFGYNRINVRSNLDFSLTKTTKFSTNLFGSNAQRTLPWAMADSDASYWSAAYKSAPDAMRPIYSNGMWGWYAPRDADVPNSAYLLATSGTEKRTTTKVTTDFILEQDLSMLTKGLKFKANFSMDYNFVENSRGINDQYNDAQRLWINPDTGEPSYKFDPDSGTGIDKVENPIYWSTQAGSADIGSTYRKLYYSFQLDYDRQFGDHEVTALGLFSRLKEAQGSVFPIYREDWVFRVTYNYAMRYFFEANGAYNGSEKFGPNYRFAFFPSLSLGWMLSEEKFMKKLEFLDMLKIRGSWGRVGDDSVVAPWQRFSDTGRFLYKDQWLNSGNAVMGTVSPDNSPYTFWQMTKLGNPNISWETVEKRNIGVDYAFLNGLIAGSVDVFNDTRTHILVDGGSRAIPSYFGATAPRANLGKVNSHGYELELRLNHVFNNGLRAWLNASMTHAVNMVKFKDDAPLLPAYQKSAGHAIDQVYSYIDHGNLATWDDVIGSTAWTTGNNYKLPGDYNIIDFNADGVVDSDDTAPYQYSTTPQNTYNASIGFEWKGFSCFAQFYGVNNVTREVNFPTFRSTAHVAYVEGEYWTPGGSGTLPTPRWGTTVDAAASGTRYWYDGSYIRLKNVELSYTFKGEWLKKLGVNTARIYLNGDNLYMWTTMPDDRESNTGFSSSDGAYPTVRRFNLGIDITL